MVINYELIVTKLPKYNDTKLLIMSVVLTQDCLQSNSCD